MVCSLHVSTKTGPTAILRCFMQPYSLTDLLLKKQRFLDTSVERLWNRTQTEDITLFPEGLTRIICGITWGRGKHGVNSDGTSCQSCHCQTEILRQSNDTQQRRVGKKMEKTRLPGLALQIILLHCHPLLQDPLPGLYPLREQHCLTSSHNHRQSM